jgi:hypothetical protein
LLSFVTATLPGAGCFSEEGDGWLWGFGTSNQLGKGDDDEGGCPPHGTAHLGVMSFASHQGKLSHRPAAANVVLLAADEVVPKKLAETKKFAGQEIIQVGFS